MEAERADAGSKRKRRGKGRPTERDLYEPATATICCALLLTELKGQNEIGDRS
jgi:hypothetical protein